jgi:Mycoplasma protein of unknown function, DUF285
VRFHQFHNANAFNSDLSDWNLSSLREASRMFKEAESFNQTLCSWGDSLPVDAVVADMFAQSDCNYKADPTMDNASLSWSGPFCSPCDD